MSKPYSRPVIVCILFLVLTACGGDGASSNNSGSDTIRVGYNLTKGTTLDKGTERFATELEKATNGSIKAELYPAGQVGNEQQMIEAVANGSLDMAIITGSTFGNIAPISNVLGVPYVFRGPDHLERAMAGAPGREIEAQINKKLGGGKILDSWYFGTRQLTSNKPINVPSDLNGVKLRVVPVPVFVSAWKTLGASPTPLDFQQLYTGLQTHLVDAQENPVSLIYATAFYQVQKYLDLTSHVVNNFFVIGSAKMLDNLSENEASALKSTLSDAGDYEKKVTLDEEDKTIKKLKAKGMKVVSPNIDAFQQQMTGFLDRYDNGTLGPINDEIQKLAGKP